MIFLVSLLVSYFSFAAEEFVPAKAADQRELTSDSILFEGLQYQFMGKWKTSSELLKTAEMKRDQMKNEFEVAKKLAQDGKISDNQLKVAALNYQESESAVHRTKGDEQRHRANAMVSKLRLLEKGNPGLDQRRPIAMAIHDQLTAERENYESALKSAQMSMEYFKARAENGKILYDKKVISRIEYERRNLDFENAKVEVLSAKNDLETSSESLKGIEESLIKLP